jgi:outer membrane biogenesis lipoprotein LolB
MKTKRAFIYYQAGVLAMFAGLLLLGCGSAKSITSSGELNEGLTAKQIIKESNRNKANFKTLQSRVKIDYTKDGKSRGVGVNLRMEKDKVIWMNGPLSIARAKITPSKVSFYDKLNNQYFDGDFALLSEFLGTELDFTKVQNLLLGEALYDLDKGSYKASTHETSYVIQPEEQMALFEIFFLLNPDHFKMDSQQVTQMHENRMFQVDYLKYQEVEKQKLPELVKIFALDSGDETIIDMEYRSVSLNEELRFPFRIPSGYDEIIIK